MALQWTAKFLDLSDDILFILFESIQLSSLAHLCVTCKRLHTLISENGWAIYYKHNIRTCPSLSSARSVWNPYENLKYDNSTDRAWKELSFVSRPLSSAWPQNCVPSVACSTSHIIYGAGRDLHCYAFTLPKAAGQSPGVHLQSKYSIESLGQGGNVTGLAYYTPDGSLIASFDDGSVTNIFLPDTFTPDEKSARDGALSLRLLYKSQNPIECMSARADLCLTMSLRGDVHLYNMASGTSSNFPLGFRWNGTKSALLLGSSPRHAALGTMDPVPLRIHSISESNICPVPSLALGRAKWDELANDNEDSPNSAALIRARRSNESIFALSDAPPYFGSSGKILVSGWMDGVVRIYDLRDSRRYSPSEVMGVGRNSTTVPTLAPIMSMHDRRSMGIGTIVSGGGAGCHIAASSVMGSLISFWDVRSPRNVWSVHAPVTKDPAPIYALAMESSRLFGATPRRPFVYDFGPGLTTDTYDAIKTDKADRLQLQSNGLGYHTLRIKSYNDRDIE